MRRARARFAEGRSKAAIRAVGEVLAIDPDNAAAKDLQTRAQEAIEARDKRAERDAAAQAVVTEARALFEKGDKDCAIARLEAFTPPHDLVVGVSGVAARRAGGGGAPPRCRAELQSRASAATPATAAFMPGRSAAGPGGHVGTGSRTPIYAGVAIALVVLVAIGVLRDDASGAEIAAPAG